MSSRYAHCSKCWEKRKAHNSPIKFTGKIDGQREEVVCLKCDHIFWVLTGCSYG